MHEQYNPSIGASNRENANQLLPTNVKPTHYDIRLEPDLDDASFEGSVIIHLDVLKESTYILLNTVELDILHTEIIEASGKITKIPKVLYYEAQQIMMVPLPEPVPAESKIHLLQTFKGCLSDSKTNSGFNRSLYKSFDGKSKWMGSTMCQPIGARQIFPCADVPALKATFSATLIVDQGLTCLSNMDIASEKANSIGKKTVVFNRTPPMSTYLIAFVVAELNYIESNDFRIPIRVYATPDQDIRTGAFALDVGARAMISHEKTFGSPYPLPKLDMIAVPGHSGAMENWGCVIYDDKHLLRSPSDTSVFETEIIALIVIHELAHQWFGNIVTAAWWDSLWLNESFADWASYNAMIEMFPDWAWSVFLAGHPAGGLNAYQAALTLDSNRGSHPIEGPVSTPERISQIFDAITYAKGCSILRMISEYLGVDVFVEGVRLYLAKHAYGNATTTDLWDALSTVSSTDVQKLMSIWTQKVGYPVLSITEDKASHSIEISQHRFLQSGDVPREDDHVLYPVYLKTKTRRGIDQEAQLLDRKAKFPIDLTFYKLNAGQTGLYRVFYPLSRWEKLGKQLSSSLLTADDRVGLLSDFGAAVISGQDSKIRTSNFLHFLRYFRDETDYFVWRQILVCLQDIRKAWLFEDAATQDALSNFQTHLMTPILRKLDHDLWNFKPTDSFKEQGLKAVLFADARAYTPVKTVANHLFKCFMDGDHKALNPNIRKAVFSIVLSDPKSSPDNYTSILHTFHTSTSPSTCTDALLTLGLSPLPSSISQTLSLSTSPEIQTSNDKNAVLESLQASANGMNALWEWMKENWAEIEEGMGKIMGGVVVRICTSGFSTPEQAGEVERFFEGKDTKKFDTLLEQSLDDVRTKARWVERDREDVREWLRDNGFYSVDL